jgi:predicted PurR-regulated permease PerM
MKTEIPIEATEFNQPATVSRSVVALMALTIATLIISVAFIEIIRPFLSALILAAICSVLVQPFHRAVLVRVGKRQGLASTITVLIGIAIVVGPLIGIAYLAASQASGLMEGADQLLDSLSEDVESLKVGTFEFPEWVPFRQDLAEAGPQIVEKTDQLLGSIASFLASSLSGLTNGTASFFLGLFTFLYAMFFFLPLKTSAFRPILENSGLTAELQEKLHDRIVSVSRATIKGTLLIGVIQGVLGGFGFWMAGIEGAAFWSVIMAIAAAIPGLGATGVVVGGAIYLAIQGAVPAAIGLAFWAIVVVGTIDNILRPTLVGRDAQMSDLMIFVSTLGGLAVFGASGLVFGPVIAGVFVSIWEAVAETSLRSDSGEDKQQTAPGPDELQQSEPFQSTDEMTENRRSLKLTASKADLDAEVEILKRTLSENESE